MKNNTTKIQSAWIEQLQQNQKNPIFARALWQNGGNLYQRFQNSYQQLLALPRKWRRAIQRKIAPSLAAAALMLALGTFPTHAVPMATIVVDGLTCSLADAITAANDDTAVNGCTAGAGADVLEIPNDLLLTAVLPDDITTDITINGNGNTIQGNDTFRLFTVAASGDLTVNDATISNGHSAVDGGGFYNGGALTLNNTTVSRNDAANNGGGIYSRGTLTLNNSTISGNTAVRGDAVAMNNATVTINDSSVVNNGDYALYGQFNDISISNSIISGNADRASYLVDTNLTVNDSIISGNGTGLYSWGGTTIINNSTISDNTKIGLHLYQVNNSTINNSTISSNDKRGLYGFEADVTINNSTITGNGTYGVEAKNGSTITLNRTIVSGNTDYEILVNSSTVSGNNHNIIGYGDGVTGSARSSGFTPSGSDIVPVGALDTILGTLGDNGGATYTHDLVPGSVAIDAAPSGACVMSPINQLDQRGYGRLTDGDGTDSTLECDVGAVEQGAVPTVFPIHEARLNGVDCALPDAITAANTDTAVGDCAAGTGDDTILLLKNSVISGSALPTINTPMTINGANYLITGSYSYQLFDVSVSGDLTLNSVDLMGGSAAVDGGIIDNSGTVAVNNSIITRGYTAQDGGGIYSTGTLTITDSTISGNSGNSDGGGLYVRSGTAVLNNSIISGNSTNGAGAGLYVRNGTVTLNDSAVQEHNNPYAIQMTGGDLTFNSSTISGNAGRASYIVGGTTTFNNSTISGNGTGLYFGSAPSTVVINDSTITGNNKGLDVYMGDITLNRTIISGNNNQEVDRFSLDYGSVTGDNYNIIGYGGSARSTNFTPSGSDIIPAGALSTILDSTLADNGGPTLTHALVSGSDAIDIILTSDPDCNPGITADQRGAARANGAGAGGAACDAGAYEYASTETPTAVTLQTFSTKQTQPLALIVFFLSLIGLTGIASKSKHSLKRKQ